MSGNSTLNTHNTQVQFMPCGNLLASMDRSCLLIEGEEVHVWAATLDGSDATLEAASHMLDREERARGARFVRDLDRRRYVLAHASVRAILGRYLDHPPEAIQVYRAESGKPYLRCPETRGRALCFNLSHSEDRLLLGISRGHEIGIDLEQVKDHTDVAGLAARYYSPDECERLAVLSPEERRREFFRYWVAKEAVLKGQGVGIVSLETCEILHSERRARASRRTKRVEASEPGWTVEWLSCGLEWQAAVACSAEDWTVRHMPATD